jgi:hypothetical protein
MANEEVMKVDKQIADLEVTLAKEFLGIKTSFKAVDRRLDSIESKLDTFQSDVKNAFQLQDDRIAAGFRDIASRLEKLASRRPRRGTHR